MERGQESASAGSRRETATALAGYLALAVLLTWPLLPDLGDRLIGHEHCTNRMHLWVLWMVKEMIFSGQAPIHSDHIFYPFGTNLVRLYGSDLLYPVVLSPLTHVLSAAVVFNLKILFSFTVAPFGAFRLLRYLGAGRAAAWGGGALFVATPYFLLETLNGVSELVAVEWIPFAVLYMLRSQDQGQRRDVALAVLFTLLACYASGYNVFFLFFFGVVLVAHRLITGRAQGPWRRRVRVAHLGAVAGICALGLLPYALLHHSGGTTRSLSVELSDVLDPSHRPMADSSASVATYLQPGRNEIPLRRVGENGRMEVINTTHTSYLGYGVMLLALLGALRGRASLWWAAAAVFVVLSLGPHLCVSGDPVVMGGTRIPLPGLLFYKLIPGFDVTMRHAYRYVAMAHLALAVLAGLGLQGLVDRVRSGTRHAMHIALMPGAVGLCLLEVLAVGPAPYPIPTTSLEVPAIYEELAADPKPFAIMELPHEDDLNYLQPYLYYQTVHGKPMIDGAVHSRLNADELSFIRKVPLAWAFIHEENMLLPLTKQQVRFSLEMLRKARFRYALLHVDLFKTPSQALEASARMKKLFGAPVKTVGAIQLYAVGEQ